MASKADDFLIPRAGLFWVVGKNPMGKPTMGSMMRGLSYNKFNQFKSFHVFSSHKASGNCSLRDEKNNDLTFEFEDI